MLSLQQRLSQQQKLSPQQIQYQKLLQLNALNLEQRIKTELELNPILEEGEFDEMELNEDTVDSDDSSDDVDEIELSSEDEFDVEDYMNDADIEESVYGSGQQDDDKLQPLAPARSTLRENLVEQLHMIDLNEAQFTLGENIIYNLDKDGYFKANLQKLVTEMKMFDHIEISLEEAEKILDLVKQFDPPGIAAADLRECLLLQLKYGSYDPYYSYLAQKLLQDYFDDFANKRFDAIQKNMDLTRDTLKAVLDLVHKLNPKPGEGNIDNEQANQITPDFLVEKVDDTYIVSLNDKSAPSVTISRTYLEMINSNKRKRKISNREKETHKFLREKFESAKWFIASIQQRRQTLLKIMRAIVEKQYEFFDFGPKALRPMIYKDIADEVMMDISTISRVVNGKYVESPAGIHELKFFFSEGLSTDDGTEISNKHIKELIKEICDNEKKSAPYSDDKIAKILKGKGINIARRTVAKYREHLGIPVARLRKEL